MEALKLKKKIKSSSLTLTNLEKFEGKDVEIIILSGMELKKGTPIKKMSKTKKVAGALANYKDPSKKTTENSAWSMAVKEKYADS